MWFPGDSCCVPRSLYLTIYYITKLMTCSDCCSLERLDITEHNMHVQSKQGCQCCHVVCFQNWMQFKQRLEVVCMVKFCPVVSLRFVLFVQPEVLPTIPSLELQSTISSSPLNESSSSSTSSLTEPSKQVSAYWPYSASRW